MKILILATILILNFVSNAFSVSIEDVLKEQWAKYIVDKRGFENAILVCEKTVNIVNYNNMDLRHYHNKPEQQALRENLFSLKKLLL